ncbi:MAG TPA: hypothetical protein VHD33_06070, partial [Legionellaceae bacterium]|nr:hypothetical protein [Legionellaceae bacterium]
MPISVKILADSVAPCGKRLITREWTYPRSIHSEVKTHRALSTNSASSRAIPVEKLIQRVVDDPFIPEHIGKNQKGMQADVEISDNLKEEAVKIWLQGCDEAVKTARQLLTLGIHKQVVNRVIEPYMWMTTIVSATENSNLWGLRDHPMAEPHFQKLARMDREAVNNSTPRVLKAGEWHLPLIDFNNEIDCSLSIEDMIKVSVGRCARVSYLTHDGRRDPKEDIRLHNDLVVQEPLHASPAEHVAQAMDMPDWWEATFYECPEFRHLDGLKMPELERHYMEISKIDTSEVDECSPVGLQNI